MAWWIYQYANPVGIVITTLHRPEIHTKPKAALINYNRRGAVMLYPIVSILHNYDFTNMESVRHGYLQSLHHLKVVDTLVSLVDNALKGGADRFQAFAPVIVEPAAAL
jgi:hypothetical protein